MATLTYTLTIETNNDGGTLSETQLSELLAEMLVKIRELKIQKANAICNVLTVVAEE